MKITVNDVILTPALTSTFGPVGTRLREIAAEIEDKAAANASGPILGIRSGDLLSHLDTRIESDAEGLYAIVESTAIHRDFGYPAFHDTHGRPWLTEAIEDVISHLRSTGVLV